MLTPLTSLFAALSETSSHHPFNHPTSQRLLLTLHALYPHLTLDALDLLDRGLVTRLTTFHQAEHPTSSQHHSEQFADISSDSEQIDYAKSPQTTQYIVKSARVPSYHPTSAPASGSGSGSGLGIHPVPTQVENIYQVHLSAWHCTCPAFTYAAFAHLASIDHDTAANEDEDDDLDQDDSGRSDDLDTPRLARGPSASEDQIMPTQTKGDFTFGGVMSRQDKSEKVTCCKHILAVALAVCCPEWFETGGDIEESLDRKAGPMKGMQTRDIGIEEAAGWAAYGAEG